MALPAGNFTPAMLLTSHYYLAALACLGFQAVAWQVALREYPLAWAYQFQSLAYIGILVVSHLAFAEVISPGNIAGSALIVTGLCIACRRP